VFDKRINNATVHRTVDVQQRRQYALLTLLATLFVVALLLYGWQQYRWIRLGYDIVDVQKKKDDLLEYQHQLILERNTLARDDRIDSIARNELGMVLAQPGQIVTVKTDDPLAPGNADAAAAPLSAAKR